MKTSTIIKNQILILGLMIVSLNLSAQNNINRESSRDFQTSRTKIIFTIPDIPGYLTLKGDFHTHTIFSDGFVRPDFRVTEAWAEDLDIIAITDHLEEKNHPNRDIFPKDANLGYKRAIKKAKILDILLIPGTEVTKQMPNPGHLNALFIKDANKILNDDPMLSIEEAINQGAFILWNHPGSSWLKPIVEETTFFDFHNELLKKGWLHGIEVFNTDEWFPIALDWCHSKGLTVFSNTDAHEPINYWYDLHQPGSHRAMTLVFAKSRTLDGVKNALFAKRTIGFFGNTLVGSEELLIELFNASVKLHKPFRQTQKDNKITYFAELENPTDLPFTLKKEASWEDNARTDLVQLPPRSITIINYSADNELLEYQVTNCYSGANSHPLVKIPVTK